MNCLCFSPHQWKCYALTSDIAVYAQGSEGPAAIGVHVEEPSCVPSMPVDLTGLLVDGWKDRKAAERKLWWTIHITLEGSELLNYVYLCFFPCLYKPMSRYLMNHIFSLAYLIDASKPSFGVTHFPSLPHLSMHLLFADLHALPLCPS